MGKGADLCGRGKYSSDEYMEKLERFVAGRTTGVMKLQNQYVLRECFDRDAVYYEKEHLKKNLEKRQRQK